MTPAEREAVLRKETLVAEPQHLHLLVGCNQPVAGGAMWKFRSGTAMEERVVELSSDRAMRLYASLEHPAQLSE